MHVQEHIHTHTITFCVIFAFLRVYFRRVHLNIHWAISSFPWEDNFSFSLVVLCLQWSPRIYRWHSLVVTGYYGCVKCYLHISYKKKRYLWHVIVSGVACTCVLMYPWYTYIQNFREIMVLMVNVWKINFFSFSFSIFDCCGSCRFWCFC